MPGKFLRMPRSYVSKGERIFLNGPGDKQGQSRGSNPEKERLDGQRCQKFALMGYTLVVERFRYLVKDGDKVIYECLWAMELEGFLAGYRIGRKKK